jgi:hypothetical protein
VHIRIPLLTLLRNWRTKDPRRPEQSSSATAWTSAAGACALLFATFVPVSAQWLNYPTPGIPRTADGKPNLTAPAPKTPDGKPDLSGVWLRNGNYLQNLAKDGVEVPFQPWAEALYKQRMENLSKGTPGERCLPRGVPAEMTTPNPFKLVQIPGLVLLVFEQFSYFRQILTDGRGHPTDRMPTWFGYSVGKWVGDSLVADTVGFNDQTWLDYDGHPHSDALHTIERFRRLDFGHMEFQITIDDPKAYTKPWTVTIPFDLLPDTELIESICENERDVPHMVGK